MWGWPPKEGSALSVVSKPPKGTYVNRGHRKVNPSEVPPPLEPRHGVSTERGGKTGFCRRRRLVSLVGRGGLAVLRGEREVAELGSFEGLRGSRVPKLLKGEGLKDVANRGVDSENLQLAKVG